MSKTPDLDARIRQAEANLAETMRRESTIAERRHAQAEFDAANAAKLWDMLGRTDPGTGRIMAEPVKLPAVQSSPLSEASPAALREALKAIDAELADHRQNVRDMGRVKQLREQRAAVDRELRQKSGKGLQGARLV
jgi:hypothetical protein